MSRPTSNRTYAKQPGYLAANATEVRQHFDTPSWKLGGKPKFDKRALFHVALADVSSLRWNEATGCVQLNTRDKRGIRAPRPMFFSERDVAVDAAELVASGKAWVEVANPEFLIS